MKKWKRLGQRGALVLIGLSLAGYSLGMGIYAVASTQPGVPSQPASAAEAEAILERLGVLDAYPFENGFVTTAHGRMHYAESGSGEGAPVLLLHGNPTWSFMYRHLLRELSDDQRLIAPDLIGFGLSEKLSTPEAYTLDGHVADVVQLVRTLDLRDLTVIVQDWGGPIGMGLLLETPERIRALVVMNTYGFGPLLSEEPPGSQLALRAVRAPLMGEQLVQGLGVPQRVLLRSSLNRSASPKEAREVGSPDEPAAAESRDPDRVLSAYLEVQGSWRERAGALAFPRWLPASPQDAAVALMQRARAHLIRSPLPMLIVWGMQDPLLGPPVLAEWRAAVPAAEVLELPQVGHLPPEEAPGEVSAAVRRFLQALPRVPSRLELRQAGLPARL